MTTASGRRARIASYRIQLTPSFGFADTIGILDHLGRLGVSHLYLSPVAEAVPGSLHGYDVVDHTRVRGEFGGHEGLMALLDAAHERDLGVVIDHVPNHMSVAAAHLNDRWWEMLRDGRSSPSARWFDVEWDAADDQVIVPKLGEPIARVLAAGGLAIGEGDHGPELRYGPLRFPLAEGTAHLDVGHAVQRQHYRLQWWRDPARNVRRFFTIDDLVAVRAEEPVVAEVIDTIPGLLVEHPAFAGVRVDHVDGLTQPEAYLDGLRRRIGADRWLVVEKILAVGETLPSSWPVDGTTGYEHIRVTDHSLLDPSAETPLTRLWTELTGDERSFAEVDGAARREVLDEGLRPDLDRLVRLVAERADRADRPWAPEQIRAAVVELTIGLHRYRTYLPDDADSVAELQLAHERATVARPDLADDVGRLADLIRRDWAAVVRKWFTAHAAALHDGGLDAATTLLALETAVTAWPIDTDRLVRPGWARSLAALTIRLTAPGVPDIYQGTVAFTYSLVDPDNRVEPDWDERRALVEQARSLDGPRAWSGEDIEAAKAVVITRVLALRHRLPDAFGPEAGYVAVDTAGSDADCLLVFARSDANGPRIVTVVATRNVADWADTTIGLPAGAWRNALDDDAQVVPGGAPTGVTWWLDRFPVAVLECV